MDFATTSSQTAYTTVLKAADVAAASGAVNLSSWRGWPCIHHSEALDSVEGSSGPVAKRKSARDVDLLTRTRDTPHISEAAMKPKTFSTRRRDTKLRADTWADWAEKYPIRPINVARCWNGRLPIKVAEQLT